MAAGVPGPRLPRPDRATAIERGAGPPLYFLPMKNEPLSHRLQNRTRAPRTTVAAGPVLRVPRALTAVLCGLAALAPACTDPDVAGNLWACASDADCRNGLVCRGGLCRSPNAPFDVVPDAGTVDSGPSDVAAELAPPDLPPDGPAELPPAGDLDAGCPDAGAGTRCAAVGAVLCDGLLERRCIDPGDGCLVWGAALDCADTNPCTTDGCADGEGCAHTPLAEGADCDDGDPETVGETCHGDVCVPACRRACDGRVCGTDGCGGECGACAAGETCTADGRCVVEVLCEDGDGDLYGSGRDCLGPDCNDAQPDVHPGAPERCNGVDDDCDELTDAADAADLIAADAQPCALVAGVCAAVVKPAVLCAGGVWADCDESIYTEQAPNFEPGREANCADDLDNDCDDTADCADIDCAALPICVDVVRVPAGPFSMGCNASRDNTCSCPLSNECPYHTVQLDAYDIDQTEVTVAQYAACEAAGVCSAALSPGTTCGSYVPGSFNYPAGCANYEQARVYCEWVGKRLCTEAEWEKAARGGCEFYVGDCAVESAVFPWGNEPATCELAVMDDGGPGCGTGVARPVGSRPAGASPYAALDLAGNVMEWVADWFYPTYQCEVPCTNPQGPENGTLRVLRGGAFVDGAGQVRASFRAPANPAFKTQAVGFRCCRTVE